MRSAKAPYLGVDLTLGHRPLPVGDGVHLVADLPFLRLQGIGAVDLALGVDGDMVFPPDARAGCGGIQSGTGST